MAGVDATGANGVAEDSSWSGPLGARALAQCAALATLRWRILKNGLRSAEGVFELGARSIALLFAFAVLGLGLGALMGFAAYSQVSHAEWVYLPILFWLVFFLWQVVPVFLASFQEQFDMSALLRFPIDFGLFFLLYVVFGLTDVATILGGMCCFGLWVGIALARPELVGWTALAVGGFALFNILMARAVFAWIDRWLAQRRTREILGAVCMAALLSLQLLNPALNPRKRPAPVNVARQAERERKMAVEFGPWLKTANEMQKWSPPGLAAVAPRWFADQSPVAAFGALGALGLYVLAAGVVLGVRLRAEYRGENLGYAPGRREIAQPETGWQLGGSGLIAAAIEKELRALSRTLPLLYALGAPLLLVLIFSGSFLRATSRGHIFPLALPLSLVYAQLGFTQFFYNNLGVEGGGIQMLFLSPAPIRTVILAKNLFHALLYALMLLVAGILATLRLGLPDGTMAAATVAWLSFSLPCNLAAGNVVSLMLPYRMNPGRMMRQRGSRANALLGLLAQTIVLGVGATVFALCLHSHRLWLAVPIFLALAGAAFYALASVLCKIDGIANRRRDLLIATLAKKE